MKYWEGNGRWQAEYDDSWNRLVPASGEAPTLQGELIRAIGRLTSEMYCNGCINWDEGFVRFTRLLERVLVDPNVFDDDAMSRIRSDLQTIRELGDETREYDYHDEDPYDRITDFVIEWCRANPKDIAHTPDPMQTR